MSRGLRHGLNVSGVGFVVGLVLVLLDVTGVFRLPAPLRAALPWVWMAATLVGITLLVGALGMPGRRGDRAPDGRP